MIRANFAPLRRLAALLVLAAAAWLVAAPSALAQGRANHIAASFVVEKPATPGGTTTLALVMKPEPGWHGYWKNPGDAGFALSLDWTLPAGAKAGEPQYPVPQTLLLAGLMNHVYEHDYALLLPFTAPAGAAPGQRLALTAKARWLACNPQICVPESADLAVTVPVVAAGAPQPADPRFTTWRAALPAPLGARASYAVTPDALRLAIPFPAAAPVETPHLFLGADHVVDYAAPQAFSRDGDRLIVDVPRYKGPGAAVPPVIDAVLSVGGAAQGLALDAAPGPVPTAGQPLATAGAAAASHASLTFGLALLLALVGGLVLNVMPCVFPILSLKAMALARAGDERTARGEGLAYTAGVMLACVALGAAMLGLRAAGEQVGWAFQLQQPGIVLALLLLAAAITANFAGLYELPGLSLERDQTPLGAFATGLLAAFVATPCTGPFMAAAMGAALVLPWALALAVFAALGLGLALPFLAIGFVPALRKLLPRPGGWMVTFRKVMAVPMALTAVALAWLYSRLTGTSHAIEAAVLALALVLLLAGLGRRQHAGRPTRPALAGLVVVAVCAVGLSLLAPPPVAQEAEAGLLGAKPFSEAALAEARTKGPVFAYFTADWCLTCKVNEKAAIERAETRDAFTHAGVTVLVGDWTRRDEAITRFLTAQGAAGVPLYLWYPRGADGRQLPQVLTAEMLANLARG